MLSQILFFVLSRQVIGNPCGLLGCGTRPGWGTRQQPVTPWVISSCLSSTPPTVHCTQRKHTQIQTHEHIHTQFYKLTFSHTCVWVCRFTNNKQIHKQCKHTHAYKGIQMQTPTCFTHTHRCKCRCMENAEIVAWVTFYFEGWEVAQVGPRHTQVLERCGLTHLD